MNAADRAPSAGNRRLTSFGGGRSLIGGLVVALSLACRESSAGAASPAPTRANVASARAVAPRRPSRTQPDADAAPLRTELTALALVAELAAVTSIGDDEDSPPADRGAPGEPTAPGADATSLHPATTDVDDAEASDTRRVEARYAALRARWRGARVAWEVVYQPALCPSPRFCVVVAFDRTKTPDAANQGWLPALRLDPAEFDALRAVCPDASPCGVRLEARIAELVASSDEPVNVTLDQVRGFARLGALPTFEPTPRGAPAAATRRGDTR